MQVNLTVPSTLFHVIPRYLGFQSRRRVHDRLSSHGLYRRLHSTIVEDGQLAVQTILRGARQQCSLLG